MTPATVGAEPRDLRGDPDNTSGRRRVHPDRGMSGDESR